MSSSYVVSNNGISTLAAAISSSSQTSITVTSGHGARFPSPTGGDYTLVTLENAAGTIEIVSIVGRSTDVLTVGIAGSAAANAAGRGMESTTATTWAIGDIIEGRATAAIVQRGGNAKTAVELIAAGGAALIGNTPAGSIAATTVQAAINELDTEKAPLNNVAPDTHAASSKATPVDADELPLADSATSFTLKKLTWANIKATLASTLSYLPAGTGAVSTTVQTKLRESVSVKDFGAVGDGATDDTAALAAALLAARNAGKKLYIPKGTYNYTAITLGTGDYLYGDGLSVTTLHYTGTGNALEVGISTIIKDLGITGTTAANNGITAGGDNGTYTMQGGAVIDNVLVTGFKQQGQVSAVSIPTVTGSGYDGTTAIVFSAPSAGVTATGTPLLSGGTLVGVTITNRGSGYTTPPTITTTGAGSGADIRAYVNSSGICCRALVTATFRNVKSIRNWRGLLTTRGNLQTTWSVCDCNFGYTEGSQGYWNGGPCIECEGLSSSNFNNTILETAGEESVKIKGKYVENVVFNQNYYEVPNLAKRGSVVLLDGTYPTDAPIRVSFNNDLIGHQPTYPLPTVNGYPSTILPMSEYIYNFNVALGCVIRDPKWISENYYYTIYAGAGAVGCTFESISGLAIHNQSLASRTQGIVVFPKDQGTQTLYGHTYTTSGGFTNDLNSTTPSVSGNNRSYKFANTSPTVVTDFLDAFVGQQIAVTFTEAFTSFNGANIVLSGNGASLYQAGTILMLERTDTQWVEVGRISKYCDKYSPSVSGGNGGFGVFDPNNSQIIAVTATSATLNFSGIFAINGVTNTVNIISDPTGHLSTTYLQAGTVNLSYTTSAYRFFNSTATTLNLTTKVLL